MIRMSKQKPRVCIIGAGPSGMSTIYQIKLLAPGDIDFECYEKQKTWGGQWNYTWRTGADEYGEHIHCCMYRNLWAIGPKECVEYIDYSFKEHFGKDLPSYLPRELYRRYLDGRMRRGKCGDLSDCVHFQHVVSSVEYREDTDDFVVWVRDLPGNKHYKEIFSHVIVASGTFSYPNMPDFPGIDTFPGRIIHSHEFREAKEFINQTVLIIGGRFSASEIAVQLNKYGARYVICSCKVPMNLNWPKGVEERPIVEEIKGNTVVFQDKTQHDVDAIIYCTGYRYNYPFLQGDLHFDIDGKTNLYPDNLYKGTLWMKGGNNKLFHMTAYEAYFEFGMFDAQAIWILNYILGKLPAQRKEMEKNVEEWQRKLRDVKVPLDHLKFQRDFYHDIGKDVNYPAEYIDKAYAILSKVFEERQKDICTYKDMSFKSMYTGKLAPCHHTPWAECIDDTVDGYL
ncbi:senecionine N-oxygenase-like [Mercenaria mercenaria]|uniref:senecionine N-oxygenase-like n=1 Tax=Mercenaria mercenaria TaxID=6596 RepID=UPI00234F1465|nr:senecionine N-oxygenase-like [Mercenaria mercenaria]